MVCDRIIEGEGDKCLRPPKRQRGWEKKIREVSQRKRLLHKQILYTSANFPVDMEKLPPQRRNQNILVVLLFSY